MSTKHGKEEKRRPIVAALAILSLTAAAIAATGTPAIAAGFDGSVVTFTIQAPASAGLAISVPQPAASATSIDLGSAPAGGETSPTAFGTVVVTDTRGLPAGTFTVSVKSTDFALAGGAYSVPASVVEYRSDVTGPVGDLTTSGTITGVHADYTAALATSGLAGARLGNADLNVLVGKTLGSGTANLNPTLVIHMPVDAPMGAYTGTVTHSVTAG